ncbi:hypothetical protein DFH09DRAFT_1338884 [Mycena vulgaris]|nr:hypothetical protein DFH09DRAFT_1338884 [Mycena vulgaris]
MHAVVDLIPMLLHVPLVLFLAGFVAFLLAISDIIDGTHPRRPGPLHGTVFILACHMVHPPDIKQPNQSIVPPFAVVPLDDVVYEAALEKAESRGRRAFAWSLTDDEELLPFLEAILEAIHGPGGCSSSWMQLEKGY